MKIITSISPADLALAKEFVRRLAEEVDLQLFIVTLIGARGKGRFRKVFR